MNSVELVQENAKQHTTPEKGAPISEDGDANLDIYLFGSGNDNVDEILVDKDSGIKVSELTKRVGRDHCSVIESIGERVLGSFSCDDGKVKDTGFLNGTGANSQRGPADITRLVNVGWVHQSVNDLLKFDFDDGISMVYDRKETKSITYLDVLRGPGEKYCLINDTGKESFENLPDYVLEKINLVKELL